MNNCQDTCTTTMAVVPPTVSIQKALSLLPISDKIGVSASHSVPWGRGGTS